MKRLSAMKWVLLQILAAGLAVAASFGYRCPAQGCPACRMVGH